MIPLTKRKMHTTRWFRPQKLVAFELLTLVKFLIFEANNLSYYSDPSMKWYRGQNSQFKFSWSHDMSCSIQFGASLYICSGVNACVFSKGQETLCQYLIVIALSLATCRENQERGHSLNWYKLFRKTISKTIWKTVWLQLFWSGTSPHMRPFLTKFPNDPNGKEYTGKWRGKWWFTDVQWFIRSINCLWPVINSRGHCEGQVRGPQGRI